MTTVPVTPWWGAATTPRTFWNNLFRLSTRVNPVFTVFERKFLFFSFLFFFFLILFIIYISLSFRQTLKELTESLSSSLFRGPIRALYAGTVLKRRQRFLSDLSISLWVTLCLPAVTARFLASSNDSSSISARTVERMASAFFEMMYVWSAWSKEVRDPRV